MVYVLKVVNINVMHSITLTTPRRSRQKAYEPQPYSTVYTKAKDQQDGAASVKKYEGECHLRENCVAVSEISVLYSTHNQWVP